jgi:hypothetical protein
MQSNKFDLELDTARVVKDGKKVSGRPATIVEKVTGILVGAARDAETSLLAHSRWLSSSRRSCLYGPSRPRPYYMRIQRPTAQLLSGA